MKKIKVWQLGILFSTILISELSAQELVDPSVFDRQGGIEISISDPDNLPEIITHPDIVLDHGCNAHKVMLYTGREGYEFMLENNFDFNYHPRPISKIEMKGPEELLSLKSNGNCMEPMDAYPTYQAYVALMYSFQTAYPEICEIISIGTLRSGREILVAHISDKVQENEIEPNFLYTSSMHGDETAGFPMMLQLIDLLTCEYNSNADIKNLVDNINIYINPLANPDGTYTDDNSTVMGATRRNANFIDLHRNFPDPDDGPHPDNRQYQEETLIFMKFAEDYKINLSCNFHGGAEVVSYPWDTFQHEPADVDWWKRVSQEYVHSCQSDGPSDYMIGFNDDNDIPNNGVTNGFTWYEVRGGRQDHMIYFHRGREFSIELSNQKIPDSRLLPSFWQANKSALLNYMEEALYGLHGIVTDCNTGEPVKAEILIPGFDIDNSSVFSDSLQGDFYRYLEEGTYDIQVIAEGYETADMTIVIENKNRTTLTDLELCLVAKNTIDLENEIEIVQTDEYLQVISHTELNHLTLYDITGRQLTYSNNDKLNLSRIVSPGIYILRFIVNEKTFSKKIYLHK